MLTKGPLADLEQLPRAGRRRRRASATTTIPRCTPRTRSRAGRGLCRASAVAVLTEEAPARDRRPRRARRRVRRRPRARGRPLAPPRRARRRRGDRHGDRASARRARARASADPVREGERVLALWSTGRAASASIATGGADPARATLLATGGYAALWERTTNPRGAVGDGHRRSPTAPARRSPTSSSSSSIRPRSSATASCSREALRGEGALLLDDSGERFTDELAPRDVVARAIAARGTALLDLRAIDREPLPDADGDARATRATTPRASRSPSRPPRTTRSAASSPTSTAATRRAGPVRRRRVRLHRRARREPARLELAARVPRLRPPRRARRARRARRSPRDVARDARTPPGTTGDAGAAGELWRDAGLIRDAAGLERLRRDSPHLLAAADRRRARSRGGEPRRPLPRRLPDRGASASPATSSSAPAPAESVGSSDGADRRPTCVRAALAEDVGAGDVTTDARRRRGRDAAARAPARRSRASSAASTSPRAVFEALDRDPLEPLVADGDRVEQPADRAASRARRARSSPASASALNLLGRLCGIATLTRRYVDAVDGTGATILDTRKTTPGLRALEKYAVRCGGGTNHRVGLDDAILIKENHLRVAGGDRAPRSRRSRPHRGLPVEVEADTLDAGRRGARRRAPTGSCSTT